MCLENNSALDIYIQSEYEQTEISFLNTVFSTKICFFTDFIALILFANLILKIKEGSNLKQVSKCFEKSLHTSK